MLITLTCYFRAFLVVQKPLCSHSSPTSLICELQFNLKSPSDFFCKDFLVHNLLDRLTSFPAALQMALCSFIFAVSSRYNSMASMILSAYTEDGKGRDHSNTHPSAQDTETGRPG